MRGSLGLLGLQEELMPELLDYVLHLIVAEEVYRVPRRVEAFLQVWLERLHYQAHLHVGIGGELRKVVDFLLFPDPKV